MAGIELYAPRTERHRRTWTWAAIVIGIVFTFLAQIVALLPFIIQTTIAVQKNPALAKTITQPEIDPGLIIGMTAPLIALILLWVWLFERRGPAAIGFNSKSFLRVARGYLIGCLFLASVVGGLWAMGVYEVEGPGVFLKPSLAALAPILFYALAFLIQGSSEETLSRGWLMGVITSRHGVVWGVIGNAVLFGAMHLLNVKASPAMFAGCFNVALFGIFISLYAVKERSIWGVCGWHGAWNWLLGVGFGLEVSGLKLKVTPLIVDLKDAAGAPWWLSGGEWGPEASVVSTFVLGAGIAWLIWKGALKPKESYPAPVSAEKTAV
ncbi:CPBP family intramembrane glutamic endopeptidase [Asticcacaulis benevestitus]|nr:CPBP family intramembrane glutamic endopeptidase [Asticcacaulis benevestitus]